MKNQFFILLEYSKGGFVDHHLRLALGKEFLGYVIRAVCKVEDVFANGFESNIEKEEEPL